eukprot:2674742-Rhodomonas_salina.2
MEANTHLASADCPPPHKVDKQFKREYQRICSRFMSNPGPSHMAAARRILRYLAGTAHGITYEAQP